MKAVLKVIQMKFPILRGSIVDINILFFSSKSEKKLGKDNWQKMKLIHVDPKFNKTYLSTSKN